VAAILITKAKRDALVARRGTEGSSNYRKKKEKGLQVREKGGGIKGRLFVSGRERKGREQSISYAPEEKYNICCQGGYPVPTI